MSKTNLNTAIKQTKILQTLVRSARAAPFPRVQLRPSASAGEGGFCEQRRLVNALLINPATCRAGDVDRLVILLGSSGRLFA